jgi:hypothetical protein
MASAIAQFKRLGLKTAITSDFIPPFPFQLSYLWDFFLEVSAGLSVSGMAPAVVTWESVSMWSQLMDIELEPWEVRELVNLGNLRAGVQSEKIAKAAKT